MKIINLTKSSPIYTSNVYLVLGRWNTLDDVNTLIDVGRDPSIVMRIINSHTGVGKKRIEQVVLTHNHYDHTSMLPIIKEKFDPRIHAFSQNILGVNNKLSDGDHLQIGDRMFEVIHTPYHSTDSICLYCEEEALLFSGDTPLISDSIPAPGNQIFLQSMRKLAKRKIKIIYGGHGKPIKCDCSERIQHTLSLMECS